MRLAMTHVQKTTLSTTQFHQHLEWDSCTNEQLIEHGLNMTWLVEWIEQQQRG